MEARVFLTCFLGNTSTVDVDTNLTMHKHWTCGYFRRAQSIIPHGGHYYTTDLSLIAQNAFSLGDFGDQD
jgi:hypothetical protein